MVTTTSETHKPETLLYPEHDKLGPLGAKTSVLDNDLELRRVLIGEFRSAAEGAREAAGKVDRNASSAVHDYRKALRRARAVLSMVSDALPKSERRAVKRALQEARRALGPSRDHAVAPETLGHLQLGEIERETANAILKTASETMPQTAELKQLLNEGAARAAAQVEALEAALPPTIEWTTVARGIRSVYDDARRARGAAKRSKRGFHTWRRRSKELTYQLELVAAYAGSAVAELHHEIESATDTQGPAVDLIMVRDFVRTYGQGVAPEAYDALMTAIDAHLDDLMKDSRKAGRAAFRRKPRKLTRKLGKAIRSDLAPPPPADDVQHD